MGTLGIKKIAAAIELTRYLSYRDYLYAIYEHAKRTLADFSYERFSNELGFGDTNIAWMLVSGKRKVSPNASVKISERLGLTGKDKKYFAILVKHNNTRLPEDRNELLSKLHDIATRASDEPNEIDFVEYYKNWFHPILREMTRLPDFSADPKWIAQKFYQKILPKQAKEGIELLERLKLIEFSEKLGRFTPLGGNVEPAPDVENMALVRYHQQLMDVARESITQVPTQKRDLQAVSVCLDEAAIEQIKELIQELCRKTLKVEEGVKASKNVCQLSVQFFAFTKD